MYNSYETYQRGLLHRRSLLKPQEPLHIRHNRHRLKTEGRGGEHSSVKLKAAMPMSSLFNQQVVSSESAPTPCRKCDELKTPNAKGDKKLFEKKIVLDYSKIYRV